MIMPNEKDIINMSALDRVVAVQQIAMKQGLRWLNNPYRNPDEVLENGLAYLAECAEIEIPPNMAGLAVALGVSLPTLRSWARSQSRMGQIVGYLEALVINDLAIRGELGIVTSGAMNSLFRALHNLPDQNLEITITQRSQQQAVDQVMEVLSWLPAPDSLGIGIQEIQPLEELDEPEDTTRP